jgi:hypothetical protein
MVVNRKSTLYSVISDKEIQNKEYVGRGEDSAGIVVNLLHAVESVATSLGNLFIRGGGGVARGDGRGRGGELSTQSTLEKY